MRRHILIAIAAGSLLSTGLTGIGGGAAADDTAGPAAGTGSATRGGSFTLTGAGAAAYRLPSDVRQAWTATTEGGGTQTRFEQVASGATVFGGQITILRNASGTATAVIGAHFPGLQAKNDRKLTAGEARSRAAARVGTGDRSTTYRIDPTTARSFYEVITRKPGQRWITWIDAGSGTVQKNIDTVANGDGIGVKGDAKVLDTSQANGVFQLVSGDSRQATFDAGNTFALPGTLMTDADDHWNLLTPPNSSPSQPAGVDAHFYGNVVDDFYAATFGRDSFDDLGTQIVSNVHVGRRYNNAYWDGTQMAYGDGDGKVFRPLSGGLDVVSHELTHGVTQYTSNLIYENESGALNESFSDMMGNTAEFFAAQTGSDPTVKPDWFIGEDVYVPADAEAGFRNMTDPQEDADPDHYSERYLGPNDNGGVHSNSGISNHAYVLAVNGGRNAGCDAVGSNGHRHTANCDENVAGVALATARTVFYQGMTSLTEYANFCDARNATVAVAPAGKVRKSIGDAWDAVGVTSRCAPGTPPPPPCTGGPVLAGATFSTPHPYGNNGDCTWTYTNTTGASFAFAFDRLETEAGFDFVTVKNAAGTTVARYDGVSRGAVTSPCLTGASGSVQLTTDGSVTAYGFDARVVAC